MAGMDFMNGMFGKIKNGMCRLSMDGKVAIKVDDGYKSYNPKTKAFVNCSNFVFDIGDEMFFVIPTNKVVTGDIILVGGSPRYVLKCDDNMITAINYKTGTIEQLLPERHIFMGKTYFYGKIVSMFGNMSSFLKGDNTNSIMKYMMLSSIMKDSGGSFGGMNPMMLMMMNGGVFGNMFDGIFDDESAFNCIENEETSDASEESKG